MSEVVVNEVPSGQEGTAEVQSVGNPEATPSKAEEEQKMAEQIVNVDKVTATPEDAVETMNNVKDATETNGSEGLTPVKDEGQGAVTANTDAGPKSAESEAVTSNEVAVNSESSVEAEGGKDLKEDEKAPEKAREDDQVVPESSVTEEEGLKEPAPVAEEQPAPVEAEQPAPVAEEQPAPVAEEQPAPVAAEEPVPVAAEQPVPEATEQPAPVAEEQPVPVEAEQLAPVGEERPAPVVAEETAPVEAAEQPAPVGEEQSAPVAVEEPVPVAAEETAPVEAGEQPAPVGEEQPAPVAAEEPVPVAAEETAPVEAAEQPAPVGEEQPAPVAAEEPVPVAAEETAPVEAAEQPAPVGEEQPAPVAAEEPIPVAAEETAPVEAAEEPVPVAAEETAPVEAAEQPAPVEEEQPAPVAAEEPAPAAAEETAPAEASEQLAPPLEVVPAQPEQTPCETEKAIPAVTEINKEEKKTKVPPKVMPKPKIEVPEIKVQLFVKAHARFPNKLGDCPFSHRVMMILKAKKIGGSVCPVNLNIKSAAFEDICSKNGLPLKVPILRHGETVIGDSNLIADYLDKLRPEPSLLCKDKKVIAAGDKVFLKFSAFVKNKMKSSEDKLKQGLVDELERLDAFLGSSPGVFLAGDDIKHPDCSLLPKLHHVRVASQHYKKFEMPESLVNLSAYFAAADKHPAFSATAPPNDAIIEGWRKHMS